MKYVILTFCIFFSFTIPVSAYDCPFGRINDPAPGQCSLYIDNNNDSFCDNSQNLAGSANNLINTKTNYYFWQLIISFIIWQLLAISLLEYQKISLIQLKKVNNYCLLISFILTTLTSLFFIINLLFNIKIIEPHLATWLHLQFGFIMLLFCIEHVIRRWQSFKIKKI